MSNPSVIPPISRCLPGNRVALHTLGCKLNYAETSEIASHFLKKGYSIVPFGDPSDVLVLNTCSVTENAERECRQLVRRAIRQNPSTLVAITGCYAQLRPEIIAGIEGVAIVLGTDEKFTLLDHLEAFTSGSTPKVFVSSLGRDLEFHGSASGPEDSRSRAFLKVQDGCDYSCSFCTIARARGKSRSAEIRHIIEQAISFSESAFHEIILTGVNVGDFGRNDRSSLFELLLALNADQRVTARIRVSSIEPNLLTSEIIQLISKSEKLCHHFHLPLQSGSPSVLRRMKRRYNADLYASKVSEIRAAIPGACIGADVIVGFPGETDSEFIETRDFIEALSLSYLHVFTYSERPDTAAVELPGTIDVSVRKKRNAELRLLSEKLKWSFYRSHQGQTADLVLDHSSLEFREGYTSNYIRVRLDVPVSGEAEVVRVRLGETHGDVVAGELLEVLSHRRASEYMCNTELLPILS